MVFLLASRRSEGTTGIAWVSGVRLWSWISNRYGRIVAMSVPFFGTSDNFNTELFYRFLTQLIDDLYNSCDNIRRPGLVNMLNDRFHVRDCPIGS
jgi:hypothetical protein